MVRTLVSIIGFALLLVAAPPSGAEDALNALLLGEYVFTETRSCLQFGSQTLAITRGTLTYNGDGTGSVTGTIFPAVGAFSADFLYSVNPDRSVTHSFPLITSAVSSVTGSQTEGQLSVDRKVLVFSSDGSTVETVTPTSGSSFTRTCGRSGTAVKIE